MKKQETGQKTGISESQLQSLDETRRVLIKKGPVSVETSLKELEENYASKPEWKVIEEGGVLSIPVEEFRMINPPKPDREGRINFQKKQGGGGKQIENYPVGQTIKNLNEQIMVKYNEEKEKAKSAGKSKAGAENAAQAMAKKLPELTAVQKWLDNEAEIKLKKGLEKMMKSLKIPALIIRSMSLKAISALKDLGLKLSGDAEIDLMMAYVSGDFLHVVIFEVKRSDAAPWQTKGAKPNKQAVNKAEIQLTKDLDVLMAILAGIPPSQIIFHTLACFPDTSISDLQTIICPNGLKIAIVTQEDLADLSLLQKKTQVPDKPDPATTSSKKYLLTLSARCLSHQSLLHIGYREVEDKEKLVTERHRYNLESVDGKIQQKEFVVASPQQQKVIASFTAFSTKRHLVLEGLAGTGKTLLALQVANNLLESATDICEEAGNEPLLVVTAHMPEDGDDPIMKYLDASTGTRANRIFKHWTNIKNEYGVSGSQIDVRLLSLTEALAKRWEGQQIMLLVDEIINKDMLIKLGDQNFPESVRMILVLNPDACGNPFTLPSSFLHVNLTTPYRSTIAITSLTHFIAKCKGLVVPEQEFGSDVEGIKPIIFDVGKDERKLKEALAHSLKQLGDNATILYDYVLPASIEKLVKEQGNCFFAGNFYGWEAERVVAVTNGINTMEQISRARTHLSVILAGEDVEDVYEETKKYFEDAADQGLVEMVQLSA